MIGVSPEILFLVHRAPWPPDRGDRIRSWHMFEALAKLVSSGKLAEPAQLLIRLHPSHFQDKPKIFVDERERIFELEKKYPHVHVVKPIALGGSLGYYGGEDMDEKSSMMAHSDVLVTVYSTMVVETAVHDTPIVAAVSMLNAASHSFCRPV